MKEETGFDRLLRESLKEELRFLNAQLPAKQKSLEALLAEESPSVACTDGSIQTIRHRELEYLSGLIPPELRISLLIPVIIEVNPGRDEMAIICRSGAEEKVFSALLGMPVIARQNRIVIHKPQLAAIRKILKTTTQYLFSPGILR